MNLFKRWAKRPQGQALVARLQALGPQLMLAAILLLTFAVYAPTLTFWFMHDDFLFLRAAQTASAPWFYVRDSFDFRSPGPPAEFDFYRPLYQASFLGFYKLFGLEAWAYHLLNVSVHLANVALLWLIARKLTGRVLVAHGAALIFALHPAYTSAVAWITAGNAVLEMLPYLASLWFFLKHLDGGPRRLWYYIASFAAFVLALLFHPEALVLTVLIVLAYGLLYARGTRDLRAVGPWLRLVPFVVTAIAYFQIQSWVRDHSLTQSDAFGFGPWFDDNYWRYMAMAIYPYDLSTSFTFTSRHLIATIGFVLISVTVGVAGPRRGRATTFVLYWFYLALIPLSTFALGADARKLYTAGPGLAILLAMFGVLLWDARPRRLEGWATGLALALVVMLTVGTIWRASETQEPVGNSTRDGRHLLDQVREEYPTLPSDGRLYLVDVPSTLVLFGDSRLQASLHIYYGDIEVRGFRNEQEYLDANLEPSEDDIIFHYSPPPPEALERYETGLALAEDARWGEAIAEYDRAVELDTDFGLAYGNRGHAHFALGQFDLAIADYSEAIDLNVAPAISYWSRGLAYRELGNAKDAVGDLERALEWEVRPARIEQIEQILQELRPTVSSGGNVGLLAGVIGAISAGVAALGGAAWWARRRWLR